MYPNKHYNILINNGFNVDAFLVYKEWESMPTEIIGWYVKVSCGWKKYSVGATELEEIYKHILEVFEINKDD